jgi:hypothetical protein
MKTRSAKAPPRSASARTQPLSDPPSAHNWATTDEDEIARRRWRAQQETFRIANLDSAHPIFSNFRVKSDSGATYHVELRDLAGRAFSCQCVDFRINGLGTCKHVEAVLNHLRARFARLYAAAERKGSARIDVVPDRDARSILVERGLDALPAALRRSFDANGHCQELDPDAVLDLLRAKPVPGLRISQDVEPWLDSLRRQDERKRLRRDYEQKVQAGVYPVHETTLPLFPYQREGMLHLAFGERALLADEMGLGKTVQAIAACALLQRMGQARRVLVVTPASLKSEWEEQIQRFTGLPHQVVFGPRHARLKAYAAAPFFTIVNYEQMRADVPDVNERLDPDVVILDEAQRIKNWSAKTTQAIKRLRSRYAFVLTGTPLENRIDELRSLIDFLDPSLLGPLFRFNRDYYELDERGRPCGYRNLESLRKRIQPVMVRRLKADVETELPDRTDRHYFVAMTDAQRLAYAAHEKEVAALVQIAKRRPLTKQQQDKLMRELAMMRMLCDTPFILDPEDRDCPKLAELEKIFDEALSEPTAKLIVFSEWERMLQLVKDLCDRLGIGYAWHTGSVPQRKRRGEILAFKNDPACRIFLSTDSGGVGLNLQNASIVVNCDLPWNPAKLEQRIARAWRKHQTRPVTVVNLVSENSIEHRMLATLAAKKELADGILDGRADLDNVGFRGGAQAFMERLRQIMATPAPAEQPPPPPSPPADRAAAFADRARHLLGAALVACEERYPARDPSTTLLVVVDRNAELWRESLLTLHADLFGPGKTDPLAPVALQVIDRSTAEALRALEANGLIANTVRATRHLYPADDTPDALSPEIRAAIDDARATARRKFKAARLLLAEDLAEEAARPLRDALLHLGKALALEYRLPAPESFDDCLAPHLHAAWGDLSPALHTLQDAPSPALIDRFSALAQ